MYEIDYTLDKGLIDWALESGEPECLVAHLMLNGVVFLNTHWRHKEWPEEAQKGYMLLVLMNDTFWYGSDCEPLHFDQIVPFYKVWQANPIWGPVAWCVAQRRQLPLPRYVERLRGQGYDPDALLQGTLPL